MMKLNPTLVVNRTDHNFSFNVIVFTQQLFIRQLNDSKKLGMGAVWI